MDSCASSSIHNHLPIMTPSYLNSIPSFNGNLAMRPTSLGIHGVPFHSPPSVTGFIDFMPNMPPPLEEPILVDRSMIASYVSKVCEPIYQLQSTKRSVANHTFSILPSPVHPQFTCHLQ